jgi:RNA-directed DNA polymerase
MEGEVDRRPEDTPAAVPMAQQAGIAMRLWTYAKPCVWTTRMLTALISGAEGGPWFRLFDKVFAERNLLAASQQVHQKKGAAGVDHVTTEEFMRQIPENLWQLSDSLKEGTAISGSFSN